MPNPCSRKVNPSLSKVGQLQPECQPNFTVKSNWFYDRLGGSAWSGIYMSSQVSDDCAIELTKNCIRYTEELDLNIDISECSTSVRDNCLISGSMQVTICFYGRNIIVDFVEDVIAHDNDCIVDDTEHTDDWDCIHTKFYQAYVAYMMPIILEKYDQYSHCGGFYTSFLSRYTKELCVYPCTIYKGGYPYSKLVPCGTSSACCVKYYQWCVDDEGTINVTPGEQYLIGSNWKLQF